MARYLPVLAIILLAFAAGAAWRQRDRAKRLGNEQDGDSGLSVLLWVPVGGAVVLALIALLLTQLPD